MEKTAVRVIIAAAKPITPDLVVPTQISTYPREKISDLLYRHPPNMCGADLSAPHVHLLSPHRGSPPAGCLEDCFFFVAEYGSTP